MNNIEKNDFYSKYTFEIIATSINLQNQLRKVQPEKSNPSGLGDRKVQRQVSHPKYGSQICKSSFTRFDIYSVEISQLWIAVAHNRFHVKCCQIPPLPRKPTVEEVKAKSLRNSVNAQKRRRARSNPPKVDAGLPIQFSKRNGRILKFEGFINI